MEFRTFVLFAIGILASSCGAASSNPEEECASSDCVLGETSANSFIQKTMLRLDHGCIRTQAGTVECWGSNIRMQSGVIASNEVTVWAAPVPRLSGVTASTAGRCRRAVVVAMCSRTSVSI